MTSSHWSKLALNPFQCQNMENGKHGNIFVDAIAALEVLVVGESVSKSVLVSLWQWVKVTSKEVRDQIFGLQAIKYLQAANH